jgi:uncharacterized protein (DUF58 family)
MYFLKALFASLYIHHRFYYIGIGVLVLFTIAFFIPSLFFIAKIFLWILLSFLFFDIILLYKTSQGVVARRYLPEKMSNGDENKIELEIQQVYPFKVKTEIIDEIPSEFQVRDFFIEQTIDSGATLKLKYFLRPTFRGLVEFGNLHIYVISPLQLIKRKYVFKLGQKIPVYPSFIQMNRFELKAFTNRLSQQGLKKVRRLGHTMEFEKIKDYVPGDDFRTVNWKATAKSSKLMVNQYQDERSQSVYCILDKGRMMKMPFEGLSLLDYAINACLVLSHVVLRKNDYAGFFSFSKKVDNRVAPDRRATQLHRVIEALYNVKTDFFEPDYGRLYADIKQNVHQRSLLILFTNFETLDGLHRQLPYLKAIASYHLLMVVFFQNTELDNLIQSPVKETKELYDKVVAEKLAFEKKLIVNELKKYGIIPILTTPANLTVNTINQYLEIKARGML